MHLRDARPRLDARGQLLLFAAAYAVYNVARWVFAGDPVRAREHARAILSVERGLGLAVEGTVQRALDSGLASRLLSDVYLAAQFVVVPVVLVWLYRRAPRIYRRLRDTVLAAWLLAVPVFALFPVAPPRLAGIGIADTVSRQAAVALTGRSTIFYNQFAAVPSLHVGFAAAVGVAAVLAARRRWVKALAASWAPLVALSVIATGNHYVLDVVSGLLIAALGFGVARTAERAERRRSARPSRPCLLHPRRFRGRRARGQPDHAQPPHRAAAAGRARRDVRRGVTMRMAPAIWARRRAARVAAACPGCGSRRYA
jgi:membrane-associated phospholipid phosphatase